MGLSSSKTDASDEELLQFGKEDTTAWSISFNDLGDHLGLRKFHLYLLLVCFIVQIPAAMCFGPAPYVQRHIREEFQVSNPISALVGTSLIMGSSFGAPLCGLMSDRYGRRFCLIFCVVMICSVNLLHLVIPHGADSGGYAILMLIRVLVGIPYGGLLTQVIPYLIEFFPDSFRGTAATSMNLSWPLGSIFAILVVRSFDYNVGWRFVFAFAPVIPGAISFLMLLTVPESPRWLFLEGRKAEAQKTLDHIFAQQPIYGVARYGKAPTVRIPAADGSTEKGFFDGLPHLFSPSIRFTTFAASALYVALCAVSNCQWAWGPDIVHYIAGENVGLGVFVYANWAAIFGSVLAMVFIDSFGRKPLLAWSFAISAVFFGALTWHAPRVMVCVLWALVQVPDTVLWSSLQCYMSEAFPTSIRGTAVGFTVIWGRLASVFFPMWAGTLIGIHTAALLWIFVAIYVAGFVLSILIPRETAGAAIKDELEEVVTARSHRSSPA